MSERTTSVFTVLGARNYALNDREENDFYATEPKALELLLKEETFSPCVWECACGAGHLSKVLEAHGYEVRSTDIADHGYGVSGIDFLKCVETFDGDIITNPPYKYALDFAKKALEVVADGHKVALFLKVQFLEGQTRRKFFDEHPPARIYVSSSRLQCAMNGDFDKYAHKTAIAHAWFIWEKGNTAAPIIKWFN